MCQTRWRFDDIDDKADIVECVRMCQDRSCGLEECGTDKVNVIFTKWRMCQDRLMDLNAIFVEVEESVHVDLEEVDKQREVLSIFLSRMCQDRFWT